MNILIFGPQNRSIVASNSESSRINKYPSSKRAKKEKREEKKKLSSWQKRRQTSASVDKLHGHRLSRGQIMRMNSADNESLAKGGLPPSSSSSSPSWPVARNIARGLRMPFDDYYRGPRHVSRHSTRW